MGGLESRNKTEKKRKKKEKKEKKRNAKKGKRNRYKSRQPHHKKKHAANTRLYDVQAVIPEMKLAYGPENVK
jgi:sRNA-binding protein